MNFCRIAWLRRMFAVRTFVAVIFCLLPTAVLAQNYYGNPNIIVSAINTMPAPVVLTMNTTGGSRTATHLSSAAGLLLGMICTGNGLNVNNLTTIYAVDTTGSTMYLSQPATNTQIGTKVTCGANAIYGNRFTCQGASRGPGYSAGGCFIHVSADGVTAAGTNATGTAIKPWEDLEYTWDFGDPSGTEIFTRPTDGSSTNANIQVGPQAAYVYRTDGAKTITLTIRARSGGTPTSPKFITATTTQRVVVSTYNNSGGTFYADSTAGRTNSGTLANPCKTMACINALIAPNTTILFAQGSHFTGSVGIATVNGPHAPVRIGQYVGSRGAGAKPIIDVNSSNPAIGQNGTGGDFFNPGGNNTKSDIVISDLTLTNSTGASGALVGMALGDCLACHMDNIYFDNLDVVNTTQKADTNTAGISTGVSWTKDVGTMEGWGIWKGSIQNPLTYAAFNGSIKSNVLTVNSVSAGTGIEVGFVIISKNVTTEQKIYVLNKIDATHFNVAPHADVASESMYAAGNYGHLFFGGPPEWHFNYASLLQGNGSIFDVGVGFIHYIYPETQNHNLYKWIKFGQTGVTGTGSQFNYCINGNSNYPFGQNYPNNPWVRYLLVSESQCGIANGPPRYFLDLSDVNNSAVGAPYRDVVVERSALVGLTNGQPISPTEASTGMTYRDNRSWAITSSLLQPSANISGSFALQAYRNKLYLPSNSSGQPWSQNTYSAGVAFTSGSANIPVIGGNCPMMLGTKVYFTDTGIKGLFTGGGVKGAFATGTSNPYYVVTSSYGVQCQVSASKGGAPIKATANGSGKILQIWSVPFAITDNTIQDDRASPSAFALVFADNNAVTGSGSIFDRNSYYAPKSGGKPKWWFDNGAGAAQDFSIWSTTPNLFDVNGTLGGAKIGAPGWTTPVTQWRDMGP